MMRSHSVSISFRNVHGRFERLRKTRIRLGFEGRSISY